MPRRTREGGFPMIPRSMMAVRVLVTVSLLAVAALAGEDCPDGNGTNQELVFPTQTFGAQNLTLTRKVFVPHNQAWARWQNIVTNTGSAQAQVGITLRGLIASGSSTQVIATSTGD